MDDTRSINMDFFETYIQLDDLCRERLGFSASDYINKMEKTPFYEQVTVPNWDKNYKKFRHMRHMRNELAHGHNAFDTALCTKGDVSWLKSMCFKIKNETDPLTLLQNQKKEKPIFEMDSDSDYIKVNWKKILLGAATVAGVAITAIATAFSEKERD